VLSRDYDNAGLKSGRAASNVVIWLAC
jgi:hypothetical protein